VILAVGPKVLQVLEGNVKKIFNIQEGNLGAFTFFSWGKRVSSIVRGFSDRIFRLVGKFSGDIGIGPFREFIRMRAPGRTWDVKENFREGFRVEDKAVEVRGSVKSFFIGRREEKVID
jgi:hypothetical protein